MRIPARAARAALTLTIFCLSLALAVPLPLGAADREPAFRDNFYDVAVAGQTAWVVGYYGTLLRSTDGGDTWAVQNTKTREALFRIAVRGDHAWISGSYGTLLHSRDRGATWEPQQSHTEEHLLGMHFLDSRHGWVVGSRGVILRTDDGGATWNNVSLSEDLILNDVRFLNPNQGWAVGEFGRIYESRDGGRSWKKQNSPIEVSAISGESRNLFRLLLESSGSMWAFGLDGMILNRQPGENWQPAAAANARNQHHHLFSAAAFREKKFAVGERGVILVLPPNSGQWVAAGVKLAPLSLNAIAFNDHGLGFIAGNRGLLLRSRDGGESWQRISIRAQGETQRASYAP